TAAPQGQAISPEAQVLMTLDIEEIKDKLKDAKEALAKGNTEDALTGVTEVENQLLPLQPQPKFTADFKDIKDSITKADLGKALDDLNKVQTDVIKAETEIFKAQMTNPQLMQQKGDNDGGKDGGKDGGDDGGNN
ncbi:MAG: hypothetical protein ACM3VV_07380, partial [Deltaproteobacteria bacterium]